MVAVVGARRRVLPLGDQREEESSSRPSERDRGRGEDGARAAAGREGGRTAGGRADTAAAGAATAAAATCLPPPATAPRPRPAAARARASSSLPKICNLRAGPAHASVRHRYRSNLTPAASQTPPPPRLHPQALAAPPGACRAPGRRAPRPERACPRPGRPWPRHCGARRLAGQQGLSGHGAPAPVFPPPCMTALLCRARKVRGGCGYVFATGLPESRGTGTETSREGAFLVRHGAPLGLRDAPRWGWRFCVTAASVLRRDCASLRSSSPEPTCGLPHYPLVSFPMPPLVWDPRYPRSAGPQEE